MGDNVSVEDQTVFEEKLQFVQNIDDSNFGNVSVFRFKQPPYEYIMDYQKTFIEGDVRLHSYHSQIQNLRKKQHKNIAKIYKSDIRQQNHMCIKDTKIHSYCNYYNFTLEQAINKKKTRQSRFTEAQLGFVLHCLLDVSIFLKNSNIVFGQYRPDHIFLTPEGYIKVFLLQIQANNKHTSYYKALIQKSLIDQVILSPEQLYYLHKMQFQPSFDIYQAQVFCIGMLILELLTLDKTKFYYNEERSEFKMGKIAFDLASYGELYSNSFLQILRGCLMENPNERLTFQQAYEQINQLRKGSSNVSYCLRLHDDEDQTRKSKQIISPKGKYIYNAIEKRLNPKPIKMVSSTSSSKSRQKNGFHFHHLGEGSKNSI